MPTNLVYCVCSFPLTVSLVLTVLRQNSAAGVEFRLKIIRFIIGWVRPTNHPLTILDVFHHVPGDQPNPMPHFLPRAIIVTIISTKITLSAPKAQSKDQCSRRLSLRRKYSRRRWRCDCIKRSTKTKRKTPPTHQFSRASP